jgi:TrwC relaxase
MAGDQAGTAYWDVREQQLSEVLQAANAAAMEYAHRWAAVTRTGYHGAKVNGQETGRWQAARAMLTSWLQGTSRDGDPQDHVHNQWSPKVQTVSDDKWRALDTMALRAQIPAVQAVASTFVESGLTAGFGVQWKPRADGRGNEIDGISQAQVDAYSSRAEAIKAATPAAVPGGPRNTAGRPIRKSCSTFSRT